MPIKNFTDNEFFYFIKRQELQFEYLKRARNKIDYRISDADIMMLYDMGIDAISYCQEVIKKSTPNN
jgi:hypothetical protein